MEGYPWATEATLQFLEKDYLRPGQSLDQRVTEICKNAERILGRPGFASAFKENFQKGWYSLATPVWTNFGTDRGVPISCFGSHLEDSMDSILRAHAEVGMMTKLGGGTSGYFGDLRGRGASIRGNGYSSGSVHFMQLFDRIINVVSQGATRRGSFAAYLPIEHPDIDEFLTLRQEGSPIQDLWFGVTVTDAWMQSMIDGDQAKRQRWARVLESRARLGGPYIVFIDNANNNAPDVYRDKGLEINASNLCTEIMLHSDADQSFVCCLSSMNILHYDEWKNTNAVEIMVYFLDSVMTEFIEKARHIPYMERAVRFAENQRAIGIGQLGWHSYLQRNMIAFESMTAKMKNVEVAKTIQSQALQASQKMAQEYGEPELLRGYGRRHTTMLAIAPTKSSAFILGQVSEGIEPQLSNYYIRDLAKGKFTFKNPYLIELLESKGQDTQSTWNKILKAGGSVQKLDCLTDEEKAVFKTFGEISQKEVIIQAAQRQRYIDQGQSLNLAVHPSIPIKDVNALIIEAWRLGVKSLYYQISVNSAQEFARDVLYCDSCSA